MFVLRYPRHFLILVNIIRNLDYAAADPADGVAEAYEERGVGDVMRHDEEVNLSQTYKGCQHDYHRSGGIAAAAQCTGEHMVDAVAGEEEAVCTDK